MKFTLEIKLGNEGMQTPLDVLNAINRCCRSRLDESDLAIDSGPVTDINGNTVGKWEVVPTAGDPHAHIGVGHCPVCGHYGQDCTGTL